MTFTTADLYDKYTEALACCDLQFHQLGGVPAFHGHIRTIRCFEDNALVKATLATPGNGAVLIVDGGSSLRTALMGDLIAASAERNGWSGVLINGAVRDVAILRTLPLGIKALGANPRKSAKEGIGEVDVPVEFGGVKFRPGDRFWSDDDGEVVLPAVESGY